MTTSKLKVDSYVRHETGDWKVLRAADPVHVWRIGTTGEIEETHFPAESLIPISLDYATWDNRSNTCQRPETRRDIHAAEHGSSSPVFVGHTRFSLFNPNSNSWKASNGSRFANIEEYKSHLYAPERLQLRSDVFVNQSLPQLEQASKGFTFRHIVSYSDTLPTEFQTILLEAAKQYPFVVLDRNESGKPSRDPVEVARSLIKASGIPEQAFGLFRLDDDDLLPVSFFRQNAQYLRPEYVGKHISLGEGITALYIDGGYYNLRQCYWPMIAIGLMNICQFTEDGSFIGPKVASHNRSDRTNPVILDSRGIGFLWARHVDQDTSLGMNARGKEHLLQMMRSDMNRFPAAQSVEAVLEEFPHLLGSIFLEAGPGLGRRVLSTEPRALDGAGISFKFPAQAGNFEFSALLDCSIGTIRGNALTSFDLVDSAGSVIEDPKLVQELRETSISRSPNPRVGFYRYISTTPGRRTYRFTVNLPDGVYCRGLTIRRWKRPETKIEVSHVSIAAV